MPRHAVYLRAIKLAAVMIALLMAAGCQISTDELYALPRLSEEYINLQSRIDAVLARGAEYSPPAGGGNRQAVQLVDLNGEGSGDIVAFFSFADEMPLRVYVFRPADDDYVVSDILEGVGTGFESVRYADMDGDGVLEIIVGWQMGAALRHMTLYALRGGKYVPIAETDYSLLTVADVRGGGAPDIAVLRLGSAGTPGEAEIISAAPDGEILRVTAQASLDIEMIAGAVAGNLTDGTPALFADGILAGGLLVTDIFAIIDGELRNITLSPLGDVSAGTVRPPYPSAVRASDMHRPHDGVVEVPVPAALPQHPGTGEEHYAIEWYAYAPDGEREFSMYTYHDYQNGWYFIMPEEWRGIITARREDSPAAAGERVVVFSFVIGDATDDFLKIYTLTGDTRHDRSRLRNRFPLLEDGTTIYAAEILEPGGAFWRPSTNAEQVRPNFGKIAPSWDDGN